MEYWIEFCGCGPPRGHRPASVRAHRFARPRAGPL